jgi:hypothetical protein
MLEKRELDAHLEYSKEYSKPHFPNDEEQKLPS